MVVVEGLRPHVGMHRGFDVGSACTPRSSIIRTLPMVQNHPILFCVRDRWHEELDDFMTTRPIGYGHRQTDACSPAPPSSGPRSREATILHGRSPAAAHATTDDRMEWSLATSSRPGAGRGLVG